MPQIDTRPNVVLITVHDLGQHIGCYGVDTVETPNIDSIAASGTQFTNAVATAPICSPARGSLLTGRYPQSNGLMGLCGDPWRWRLDDRERALPQLLNDAGYETHLAGRQNVVPDGDEERLGFDQCHHINEPAEKTAGSARGIFADAGEGPIYAQFGFVETHRPFEEGSFDEHGVTVPEYLEDTPGLREDLARFQADINYLDDRVGEILEHLETTGHREDTVVVFAVDHGIPYTGAKWTSRDPGTEVGLLIDMPGVETPEPVDSMISQVDVVPTVLDAIDLSIPAPVQGVSYCDYLRGDTDTPPRDIAFTEWVMGEQRSAVTTEYTLIRNFERGTATDYPVTANPDNPRQRHGSSEGDLRPVAELYDRTSDPANLEDVAADRETVCSELSDRVRAWMTRVDDPLLGGFTPTPYYRQARQDLLGGTSG